MNTISMFKVLGCLCSQVGEHPQFSYNAPPMTSRELARQCGVNEITVCKILQLCVNEGYVERIKRKHQMGKVPQVTDKGIMAFNYFSKISKKIKRIKPELLIEINRKIKENSFKKV